MAVHVARNLPWRLLGTIGAIVDALNRATMRGVVEQYRWSDDLDPHEVIALSTVAEQVRGGRILDIGVGAGRTVKALRSLSSHYVGVDYVEEMVEHCRHRFPDVQFEVADARSMPQFSDGSFDLVMFACNGISMVDHEGRLAILAEVARLLAPGGYFVFSTANLDNPNHDRFLLLPKVPWTWNPAKLGLRLLRFVWLTLFSLFNRLKYRRYEQRTDDWAVLNDRCHEYRTLMYFTTLDTQRRQLRDAGFSGTPNVFDLQGQLVEATTDGTMTFTVRR